VSAASWRSAGLLALPALAVGLARAQEATQDAPPPAVGDAVSAGVPPLEYTSWSTLYDADRVLHVIQAPRLRQGAIELRASWAVLWIDRAEWERLTVAGLGGEPALEEAIPGAPTATSWLGELLSGELGASAGGLIARYARELYLEGPIQYLQDDRKLGQAGALYLDLVDGHGWVSQARFSFDDTLGGQPVRLRAETDWMRISRDGSFRASLATLTACEFARPHVTITSRDLRLVPTPQGELPFFVSLRDNSITLYETLTLPLPPIGTGLTERFEPAFNVQDNARFGGLSLGLALATDLEPLLGDAGQAVNTALGGTREQFEADGHLRASVLGSRGGLLDFGAELASRESYHWESWLGVVLDGGEDKGIIRVPEADRGDLRTWFRSRARVLLDERQWIDLTAVTQSDAAVQSEFWEDEFLRYEERDSYAHWRRARGESYAWAIARGQLDDFRTGVAELPAAGFARGRVPLLELGGAPLLHSGSLTAGALRRSEGDSALASPFEVVAPFADGLGEREVLRADLRQRLELAWSVGGALRVIPFSEVRATAWSENAAEDDQPSRLAALSGLRVAAHLWRQDAGGGLTQLAPFAELRADALLEQDGGDPVAFDEVEESPAGEFVSLGCAARWRPASGRQRLDVSLAAEHAADDGAPGGDGWRQVELAADWSFAIGRTPFEASHDGRFDPDPGGTLYSRSRVAFNATPAWGFEMGHTRGLDSAGDPGFEAASIASLFRWTEKWELEGRETFDLLGSGALATKAIVRRWGHDLVLELEVSTREAEGTSFGLNFKPVLGARRRSVGIDELLAP
jgi:hypothetical protein